jgi:hypothetical protein
MVHPSEGGIIAREDRCQLILGEMNQNLHQAFLGVLRSRRRSSVFLEVADDLRTIRLCPKWKSATNRRWPQTALFSTGEALNRTVFPAFTRIGSPVRGLTPLRALVRRTENVPKPGKVNFCFRFNSLTIASITASATCPDPTPVKSSDP